MARRNPPAVSPRGLTPTLTNGVYLGPERVVFDGTSVRSFAASDDDEIMMSAETVRGLGSYAAVLSHLAAAELEIPPLRVNGSA